MNRGRTIKVKISLPPEMYRKLYETAKKRGYVSVSEYIRDLVRRSLEGSH